MNDGKIIIDRIMAEADKEIEAFMLEGKREADAIMIRMQFPQPMPL